MRMKSLFSVLLTRPNLSRGNASLYSGHERIDEPEASASFCKKKQKFSSASLRYRVGELRNPGADAAIHGQNDAGDV